MGASTFRISHAYAFAEKAREPGKENCRVLLTEKPLSAAATKLAATAGENEEHRQQLVLELAEQGVNGIEAIVAADKSLLRVNVYSPASAMGLMLLDGSQAQVTALDGQKISGRVFTEKAVTDSRIGGKTHPVRGDVHGAGPPPPGAVTPTAGTRDNPSLH